MCCGIQSRTHTHEEIAPLPTRCNMSAWKARGHMCMGSCYIILVAFIEVILVGNKNVLFHENVMLSHSVLSIELPHVMYRQNKE